MTDIRPELSKTNPTWIGRHRYYELKHFCLQYPEWKKIYKEIDGYPESKFSPVKNLGNVFDPVIKAYERREEYINKIEMIERCAKAADEQLYGYLLHGVTEGVSYYGLRLYYEMPACKEKYYGSYRRFFFLLDKARK